MITWGPVTSAVTSTTLVNKEKEKQEEEKEKEKEEGTKEHPKNIEKCQFNIKTTKKSNPNNTQK